MTAQRELTTFVEGDYTYFEGIRWRDDRLWFSDLYLGQVLVADDTGTVEKVLDVPGQPSGLGWLPDGSLLVVSMKDRRLLRYDGQTVSEYADLSGHAPCHLNDMVVDTAGRAWVSNFGSDVLHGAPAVTTAIYRVDPDRQVTVAADDLLFPNGIIITVDGRLLVAESMGNRITAFDIAADGTLDNRHPFALFGERPALGPLSEVIPRLKHLPDGMTSDAEGGVWFADPFAHRALRILDGKITEEIDTSPLKTDSVTLGGRDGRTLFLCTAPSMAEHECRAQRGARILATTVDVPHAGLP